MNRGDIYTVAARGAYTGKPRPAVIVQDDRFDATASVTICPFTTDPTVAPLIRIPVIATERTGLDRDSYLMVDKIVTVPRSALVERLGAVDKEDLVRLTRSIVVFLGLAA